MKKLVIVIAMVLGTVGFLAVAGMAYIEIAPHHYYGVRGGMNAGWYVDLPFNYSYGEEVMGQPGRWLEPNV